MGTEYLWALARLTAVAIETVGPFRELFRALGIDPGLRVPDPPVMIRVNGRDFHPGAPVWEHLVKRVTKAAARVAESVAREKAREASDGMTLDQWLQQHSRSRTLQGLFQSLAASIFTVNSDELPATAFFRLLRETGGDPAWLIGARPDQSAAPEP